jgi:hypothetical protein
LGEWCTVFMESSISAELARGTLKPDIAVGICYSIVRNYLTKVVGNKAVGQKDGGNPPCADQQEPVPRVLRVFQGAGLPCYLFGGKQRPNHRAKPAFRGR